MSNLIDFTQLGGYRLEQPTFEKMQATYYLFLKAMIGHFGIADVGNFIISGCEIDGANITEGIMYIDGVICPFETASGTLASKIKRQVTTQTLSFENGTTPVVFQKFTAVSDAAGTALSDFIRVPSPFNLPANLVIDANYVHTDNNFTNVLLDKLLGIQAGAQVNVIPSFAQSNPAAPNYIADKPEGQLLTYLRRFTYIHGDVLGSLQAVTIQFADVGNTNYVVLGTMIGGVPSYGNESRINWIIAEKTTSSFKLIILDLYNNGGQNVKWDFVIVPNN